MITYTCRITRQLTGSGESGGFSADCKASLTPKRMAAYMSPLGACIFACYMLIATGFILTAISQGLRNSCASGFTMAKK